MRKLSVCAITTILVLTGCGQNSNVAVKRACDVIGKSDVEKLMHAKVEEPRANDPPAATNGSRLSNCHWKTPGSVLRSDSIDLTIRTAPTAVPDLISQIREQRKPDDHGDWQETKVPGTDYALTQVVSTPKGPNAEVHLIKNGGRIYIVASAIGKESRTTITDRANSIALMALVRLK